MKENRCEPSWTVNAYTLAFAAGIIPGAAAADRFGRRRIFAFGLALFAAASAACALAPNGGVLILARTVQGLAAALVAPVGMTILTSAFPIQRRGAIVGVWGGVAGLAVASGPLVGGVLTQTLGWHAVFWLNVPIGLLGAALSLLLVPESFGPPTRIDVPAVGLISSGAVALVLGLVRAADLGWTNVTTISSLVLGAILLTGFVAWEVRAAEPMVPMRLFRSATFSAANTTGFFMSAAQFAAAFLIAQYFQLGRDYSPMETGLRILPWTATPLVVAPLAGALSDRLGRRPLMLAGMALQAAGFVGFAAIAGGSADYWQTVVPLVVAGVGVSMVLPVTPAAVLSAVEPVDIGRASGVSNMLQRFGTAFGVAVVTAVFLAKGNLSNASTFDAGLGPAIVAAAGLSVLGALSALAVRKQENQARPSALAVRSGEEDVAGLAA